MLFLEQPNELFGSLQKSFGMGQKELSVWRQGRALSQAAALFIEFHSQPRFKRYQSAAESLFRDEQLFGGDAETPLPRQLDECGDLIGRKRQGQFVHNEKTVI